MDNEDFGILHNRLLEREKELVRNFSTHEDHTQNLYKQGLSDEIDYASMSADMFVGDTLMKHHKNELDDIEIALQKFEQGLYGMCEMCGDAISLDRLRIKPHAKYCITCREYVEKERNKK